MSTDNNTLICRCLLSVSFFYCFALTINAELSNVGLTIPSIMVASAELDSATIAADEMELQRFHDRQYAMMSTH